MRRILSLSVALAALLFFADVGRADLVIAYDNAPVAPNQFNSYSLGLDFNVGGTPITVGALGAFDSGNLANLAGQDGNGVTVGIFDRTTGTLVGPSVQFTPTTPGITQINGDAFLSVTPFTLPAGFQGSIVASNVLDYNQGFPGGQVNPTSTENSGGGLISFVGDSRYSSIGAGFVYPTIIDTGPTNRYDAGTFEFTAATPEPSTLVSTGTGALLALCYAYRRHRRAAIPA